MCNDVHLLQCWCGKNNWSCTDESPFTLITDCNQTQFCCQWQWKFSHSLFCLLNIAGSDLVLWELSLASGPWVQSMISSKSHETLSFSQYLIPATIFFTHTGETFTSKKKKRHMPVSQNLCWCMQKVGQNSRHNFNIKYILIVSESSNN